MKAVLFDLDDTVYPEIEFVRGGFRAVAEFLSGRYRQEADDVLDRLLSTLEQHGRGRIFDIVLAELGLPRPELVATLVYIYRSHRPSLSLYPDVPQVFARLREHGLKLGVVTDGLSSVQRQKIEALGLRDLDAVVLTAELAPATPKPSSLGYQVALELLGLSAEDAVYVGNDPTKDFLGANMIGMQTLRVRQPSPGFPVSIPTDPAGEALRYVDPFSDLVGVVLDS